MKDLFFSFIVPVYNRPVEIKELLESFEALEGDHRFEIVIVEDGSSVPSKAVIEPFKKQLEIAYYFKQNSGPGDSRNYGMTKAKGNYFIILDSDVLLPPHYLSAVVEYLEKTYVDCYGGPDAAHPSFSPLQKAIDFAMTSFMTTGGIRGNEKHVNDFQPRSFNMGLSQSAFEASGGFGKIHPGEDPDLSLRLNILGFETRLISKAYVYHKRRISWSKFYKQVNKFGLVRPILNKWHPDSQSIVYWFPSFFSLGLVLALCLALFFRNYWLVYVFGLYFGLAFIMALAATRSIWVGMLAMLAILIQFFGYGYGFITATLKLRLSKKQPERLFPKLFFN